MRMLLSVAVVGLMVTPAMADLPAGVFKANVHLRASMDGRGQFREEVSHRVDAYERLSTRNEKTTGSERMHRDVTPNLPFKTEIALRARGGDDREGAKPSPAARNQTAARPAPDKLPPLPFKTEIMMKMQKGDSREGAARAATGTAAKKDNMSSTYAGKYLTPEQKAALCAQTGVCLQVRVGADHSDER